jgi:hypothetical protein
VHRQIEVHSGPHAGGYQSRQVFTVGEHVPIVIDGVEVGRIAVDDLMT